MKYLISWTFYGHYIFFNKKEETRDDRTMLCLTIYLEPFHSVVCIAVSILISYKHVSLLYFHLFIFRDPIDSGDFYNLIRFLNIRTHWKCLKAFPSLLNSIPESCNKCWWQFDLCKIQCDLPWRFFPQSMFYCKTETPSLTAVTLHEVDVSVGLIRIVILNFLTSKTHAHVSMSVIILVLYSA
jgi:hypothetical protein